MKTLIIVLALLISAPTSASGIAKQQTKSASDLLKEYRNKKPESDHIELENQIVKLQLSLRETRRKYYTATKEVAKLKAEIANAGNDSSSYTDEHVEEMLAKAQSDIYYNILTFTIAEREFLLSLDNIEDMKWLLVRTKDADFARVEELKGNDQTYLTDIANTVTEYQSYYNKNRTPAEEKPAEQQQE